MKLIGHAGCAVLAAAPVVYLYPHLPPVLGGGGALEPWALFAWAVFWSMVPDFDLAVQRVFPFVRHRGFLSHSLYTALVVSLLVLGLGMAWPTLQPLLAEHLTARFDPALGGEYLTPVMALLAGIGVLSHILGDALTVSGVPLWKPGREWHMPVIGGYAAYDNYFLNAIPVALALWLLHAAFGLEMRSIHRLIPHFAL